MVEFKTDAPPETGPSVAGPSLLNWADYLVWCITIIEYNLKGGRRPPCKLPGLQAVRDDCFQEGHGRKWQGSQGAGRRGGRRGRAAARRIVRAARLFSQARAAEDLRGLF